MQVKVKTAAEALEEEFMRYLLSGKFRCGNDLDGYISTTEVLRWMQNIRSTRLAED